MRDWNPVTTFSARFNQWQAQSMWGAGRNNEVSTNPGAHLEAMVVQASVGTLAAVGAACPVPAIDLVFHGIRTE